MKIEELEKDLDNGNLRSLYLLYGDEKFLLDNCRKKIEKLFGEKLDGINYILIDDTNINEIISDIETPAFGFEKKLIIAKNSGLFSKTSKRKTKTDNSDIKNKLADYLKENIDIINQSVILVFIEDKAEKCDLLNIINKFGIVCKFDFLKPFQIESRLKKIVNAYGVNIDKPTLSYFIECCGTNMQELINEIRKLIEYEGKGGIITKDDIDKISTKKIESVIFDLTDSLGKKDVNQAIDVLRNLVAEKEPLQKILITLYNHFKKLYLTKIAIEDNKDIATSLDLKPNQMFLVNKYKMQASFFKKAELRKILEEFCTLDYKYKIGLIDLNIGLESILCNI